MIKKEIVKIYGNDIFQLGTLQSIKNLIRRRSENNLSLDKLIIKQKLIELKKYYQIYGTKQTLERYIIIYDYYAQREYKKYVKKKTSEFIKPNPKKDSKSLNYYKKKYGDNELAVQKYEENCKNVISNTKIEYYLRKGMSLDEASKALRERQRTFTLEKCQKKYGLQKGKEVWEARQQKWQNTLNSKSDEEINDINKRKCEWLKDKDKVKKALGKRKANREKLKVENPELYHQKYDRFPFNWLNAEETDGYLYYLHIYNDNADYYKIGITKFSNIKYRFNVNKFKENHFNFDVIFLKKCCNYKDAYIHEQNILNKFSRYRIFVDYNFFSSSEVFNRDIFEGKYDEINI